MFSFLQRLADCKRIFNPRIRVYVWCANGNFGSVLSLPPVNSVFSEDRVEMTGTTVACLFKARDVLKGRVLGRQTTIHMCNEKFRFAYNLCTMCRHQIRTVTWSQPKSREKRSVRARTSIQGSTARGCPPPPKKELTPVPHTRSARLDRIC